MHNRLWTLLTLALSISMFSGCAVTLHNTQWWTDQGRLGAVSFDTLDNNTSTMDKADWDLYRFGMICGKPASFAELKSEIEQFCNKYGCTKDQAAALASIWGKIEWAQP